MIQKLDKDDGILTADEIAALSLEGVDLVVLSACETGLGEVAGGEGLLGVQRAFLVAGAHATVASLWEVGDVPTRRLMERFYRNYWEHEMSKVDALREAQLYLLNHPEEIRGVRRVKPGKDDQPQRLSPEFWAAFVLSGDWKLADVRCCSDYETLSNSDFERVLKIRSYQVGFKETLLNLRRKYGARTYFETHTLTVTQSKWFLWAIPILLRLE